MLRIRLVTREREREIGSEQTLKNTPNLNYSLFPIAFSSFIRYVDGCVCRDSTTVECVVEDCASPRCSASDGDARAASAADPSARGVRLGQDLRCARGSPENRERITITVHTISETLRIGLCKHDPVTRWDPRYHCNQSEI